MNSFKKLLAALLIVTLPCIAFAEAPFHDPVEATLAAEDITTAATLTSAGNDTYVAAVAATKKFGVIIQNTTDVAIVVSFDAGSTEHITMDAGDDLTINFREFGLVSNGGISVKDNGSSPSSGEVRILLIK